MGRVLETIKIAWPNESGYLTINKADFDSKQHFVYGEEVSTEPPISSRENRQSALEAMDWREIKAIAEEYNITKPEEGWDDAIPLILDHEFGGEDGKAS